MLLAEVQNEMGELRNALKAYSSAFTCTDKTDVRIYILSQLLHLANRREGALFCDCQK